MRGAERGKIAFVLYSFQVSVQFALLALRRRLPHGSQQLRIHLRGLVLLIAHLRGLAREGGKATLNGGQGQGTEAAQRPKNGTEAVDGLLRGRERKR